MSDIFVSPGLVVAIFFGVIIVGALLAVQLECTLENKCIWPCGEGKSPTWFTILTCIIIIALAFAIPAFCYVGPIKSRTELANEQYCSDTLMEVELQATHFDQEIYGEGYYEEKPLLRGGEGSFVISSMGVYRYYYRAGDRFHQTSVPINEAYIEYIYDDSNPRLVKYHDTYVETYRLRGTDKTKDKVTEIATYYVFYVPEGSVTEVYDFN